jgi:hypothetical protein
MVPEEGNIWIGFTEYETARFPVAVQLTEAFHLAPDRKFATGTFAIVILSVWKK